MSNSISVNTYKINLIEDTGYKTWLDFWLNTDTVLAATNVAAYQNAKGNLEEIQLPFNERILELLVREEFSMILEHLSCKNFDEFEKLTGGGSTFVIQPIELIVRTVDGSVYFRQYMINALAYKKLKALFSTPLKYTVWQERTKP
ncbi:MAG TPA: hypothetical protein VHW43_01260 [Puia sp.]|nr:hypothetical protein [Puia sp.]